MVSNPVFSEDEFKKRHDEIITVLDHIDTSIIFCRADLTYYSGIGMDGVIVLDDQMTHYVRRNLELAKEESMLEVNEMPSFRLFKDLSKSQLPKTLGMELDLVPYKTVEYIKRAYGNPEIVDISQELRSIRSIKSSAEIALMEASCRQTDESFEFIQDKIIPGKSELEISAEIEHFLRKSGHPGFVQVRMFHHNLTSTAYVMAGESTATLNSKFGPTTGQGLCKMHKSGPSHRKIQIGDAVLIDTTGVVEGYISDVTRTFFVGNVNPGLLHSYEFAKEVQNKIADVLIDGNNPSDIYSQLIEMAAEYDVTDEFMGPGTNKVPFIGHGVGLELDEFPIITSGYKTPLKTGQTVAVEPKLISQKLNTGVGIEDTWVVGENSAKRLSQFPW